MNTPVAIIVFNRPDKARQLLKILSLIKPRELFVIADGPRDFIPEDKRKCKDTRELIENLDWECKVFKNYSEVNLGCGIRPATGISWVFEHVDKAIFLEDDCKPHPSFIRFCKEILEKYAHNERVMQIGGTGFSFKGKKLPSSYCFSSHNHCFGGWATWKRAWENYDIEIKKWPELRETKWLQNILKNKKAARYWENIFNNAHMAKGTVDYWDYQWRFAFWEKNGLSVIPYENLISNIGFDNEATHTKWHDSELANMELGKMRFPLTHPLKVGKNIVIDRYFVKEVTRRYEKRPIQKKIRRILKNVWNK